MITTTMTKMRSNDVNKLENNISHIALEQKIDGWWRTCWKWEMDKSVHHKSTCFVFTYYNDLWAISINSNTITASLHLTFLSLSVSLCPFLSQPQFSMPWACSIQINNDGQFELHDGPLVWVMRHSMHIQFCGTLFPISSWLACKPIAPMNCHR